MQFDAVPEDVRISKEDFQKTKAENTANLKKVKQLLFDYRFKKIDVETLDKKVNKIVDDYITVNNLKNEKYQKHLKIEEENRVLGFDNNRYFWGEFGWAIGSFLIVLKLLFREYRINRIRNKYLLLELSIYLYIYGLFAYYPLIYKVPLKEADYSNWVYSFSLLFTVVFIIPCAYFVNKYLKNNNETTLIRYILHFMHNPYMKVSSRLIDVTPEEDKQALIDEIQEAEDATYTVLGEVLNSK